MKVTTRMVSFFLATSLGAMALIQGARYWQRQAAYSHQVFAEQAFCTIIQQPIVHNSQPPYCLFDARAEQFAFSSDYILWIVVRGEVTQHRVPARLILSVVEN